MEFKIDFLRPGRDFPKNTAIYRLKKGLHSVQNRVGNQLIKRVGTSLTTLVISFAVLISACLSFYMLAYRPRQRRLQELAQEIGHLETMVSSLKGKRRQEQTRRNMIKARINQLINIRRDVVPWTDKLKAINRNLVKGIWLTSLEVKQKTLKPKQKDEDKKRTRRRRAKKEEEEEEKPASQIRVSINGATYAFLGSKPLKLIAGFMTDLMNDPVWERDFDLTDWMITTSEADEKPTEELEEDFKIVSFRLELERKQ